MRALLGLVAISGLTVTAARASTIDIVPIGDSITQGNGSYNSWRRVFWHTIRGQNAAGFAFDVDMVGSMTMNFDNAIPICLCPLSLVM